MATIKERAKAAEKRMIEEEFSHCGSYILGATQQREIDIEKACEVYKSELKEIADIITRFGEIKGIDNLGDIISIDGSLRDFRKAMEK